MAGHSKWHNIKNHKGVVDAKTDPELVNRVRNLYDALSGHEDVDEVIVSVNLPVVTGEEE